MKGHAPGPDGDYVDYLPIKEVGSSIAFLAGRHGDGRLK